MGIFDFMRGKTAATPVFNPNDPMQGFYDPTEEERKQARKMAALQAGAGMLMGNTGNYGAFAPALGAGIAQGVQGYQQGLNIGPERRMKEMQQKLYGQQVEAQTRKAFGDKDDDEVARGIFQTVFQDAGYDPETGGFLPVSTDGQVGSSPLSGTPITQDDFAAAKPANPMDSMLDELGWTAGRKKFFMSQYKADPKAAMKNLERAYIELDRSNRRGKTEARDVIAKEKAMAEAMGIPVGEYLKQRMIKQPLVDMRGANFGGSATLPSADEAAKTAGKAFGNFAMEAVQSANSAYDIANDIQIVEQGLRGMGGGPVAEFKAWAGKIMPGDSEWGKMASMNDLAKTIQVKLAPTMRAAGSGATSDFEMKAFMAAIPSLATTEKGRTLMARYSQKIAERAQIRAEIVNEIEQSGRLPTPKEISDRMKARVGDRFFDDQDRSFFGMKSNAPQRPAQARQAQPTTQGQPGKPSVSNW
jgi:hypothetical protein